MLNDEYCQKQLETDRYWIGILIKSIVLIL